jgi:hypothetical protein
MWLRLPRSVQGSSFVAAKMYTKNGLYSSKNVRAGIKKVVLVKKSTLSFSKCPG